MFARAREKARQTSCLNNLKQIATAHLMYAQDYDETFLSGRYPGYCVFGHAHTSTAANDAINDYQGWSSHLHPYIMNAQIWQCPSETWTTCTSGSGPAVITNAYLFNFDGCAARPVGQIRMPAEQMISMDGQGSFVISSTNTRASALGSSGIGSGIRRHNGGANIAFCDGHAKWMGEGAISGAIGNAGVWSDFLGITME